MYYRIYIDKNPICFKFREENTLLHFGVTPEVFEGKCTEAISVPQEAVRRYVQQYESSRSYAESMNALYLTSNALLDQGYCAFHAAAVCINGRGFLFAGESGVGKSTQYMNLKRLYPEQVQMINGDKPFLHFHKDESITIHTSPWRGKEGFGSDIICKLDSIILLKQAEENHLVHPQPENVVVRCFKQFLYYADSESVIHQVCDLERILLKHIPVFIYENTGTPASSELLYQQLLENGAASYE